MSALQECLRKIALRSASIFGTRINPTNVRNGNKHAKKNLLGPSKLNYYPEEFYISQMYRDMLKKYKNIEIEEDLLLVRKLATRQLSITDILQGKMIASNQQTTMVTSSSAKSEQTDESVTSEPTSSIEDLTKDRSLFLLPAHPVVYHKEARAKQLRARGRGAPKKGQGKRLTLKKK